MSNGLRSTALGTIVGTSIKLLFAAQLWVALGIAFCTGAAAYAGQLVMKYAHAWCKNKIKIFRIKFNSPKNKL